MKTMIVIILLGGLASGQQQDAEVVNYQPGDQVVVIEDSDLVADGQVVARVDRGFPLVIQAVEGDRIRVTSGRSGWIAASAVVPRDRAIAHFSNLINQPSPNQQDLYARGMVWLSTGNYDKAIADFTASIEIQPRSMDYNERGYCWMIKGETARALEDFNKALELSPDSTLLLFNRGLAYEEMGDLEKAVTDYDAALAIDPQLLNALHHRGNVRMRQELFEEAIADFSAAIDIDPQCVD